MTRVGCGTDVFPEFSGTSYYFAHDLHGGHGEGCLGCVVGEPLEAAVGVDWGWAAPTIRLARWPTLWDEQMRLRP